MTNITPSQLDGLLRQGSVTINNHAISIITHRHGNQIKTALKIVPGRATANEVLPLNDWGLGRALALAYGK